MPSELIHLVSYTRKRWGGIQVRLLTNLSLALAMSIAMSAIFYPPALGKDVQQLTSGVSPGGQTSRKKPLPQSRGALVGNIRTENIYEGCGCYFQFPSDLRARSNRHFFITDQSRRAWMNIEGKDVELHLTGADHVSLRSKKGERMDVRFETTGIQVRVKMLVTRTSTYEADYEPAHYAVTVQVAKGHRRQTVRTSSSCGC